MGPLNSTAYLLSAVLFIMGLKRLGSPKTARSGNLAAASAMLLAVTVTLFDQNIVDFKLLTAGLVVGAAIGAVAAKKVRMTAMPQLVALFNGLGGIASALVAFCGYLDAGRVPMSRSVTVTVILSLFIGTATFSGSLIAFGKLQGIISGRAVRIPMLKGVNVAVMAAVLACAAGALVDPGATWFMPGIVMLAVLYGLIMVLPVGGADMPVVIALLNAYSGLAAAATGFVLSSYILIISGALVGTSGLILTQIMCSAMNRNLRNVLFAGAGGTSMADNSLTEQRHVTAYTAEEAAMVMEAAGSVIVVPGYGLAVAQAQHVLFELTNLLIERDIRVRFAIHPVAGRMPGHMNVLLAEANVPYDMLVEMDGINGEFKSTDLVLVVGANDVTNHQASCCMPESPLFGMPTLKVDEAKSAMVIKRSLGPGYAGIDNDLFYADSTMMLFGDARQLLAELVKEVEAL